MDLNALEDFHLVAAHGGFGKASRASGRSKATLSRRVADLEESLGCRLIERSQQGLELTESGHLLLNRTLGPLREIVDAAAAAKDGIGAPRGQLRIAAPVLFAQVALGGLAAKFHVVYPEIRVEVVAEDRMVNLVEEHFDVAVRINPAPDSLLVGKCFAKDRLVLTAAPSIPQPDFKTNHVHKIPAIVPLTYRDGDLWRVCAGQTIFEPQPVLRLSSLLTVRDAAVAGAGVAMLPQSIIASLIDQGKLVTWGIASEDIELWILHTSRRLQSPKVRAFVDFMCGQYPKGIFSV